MKGLLQEITEIHRGFGKTFVMFDFEGTKNLSIFFLIFYVNLQ